MLNEIEFIQHRLNSIPLKAKLLLVLDIVNIKEWSNDIL